MDIMSQKMDEQMEGSQLIEKQFNEWLYEVCRVKAGKDLNLHNIFPYIQLADAKLSFLDGMSAEEYSKTI